MAKCQSELEPCAVDFAVGGDFRFGEGTVVDAQGVVSSDGTGRERIDEEAYWT